MLRKAWRVFKSVVSGVIDLALYIILIVSIVTVAVVAPDAHHEYLRAKVGSRTYLIQTATGSGTGFAMQAPSGKTYIVSNAHVCDYSHEVWVTDVDGVRTINKVIKEADKTDLCLIEGRDGVEGLLMGSRPHLGQMLRAFGHPSALPLSESKGELYDIRDEILMAGVIGDTSVRMPPGFPEVIEREHCNKPINFIQNVNVQNLISSMKYTVTPQQFTNLSKLTGLMPVCYERLSKAYATTGVVSPGSSGSPVVDIWGRVIAVVVGYEQLQWGWTIMVPYDDLASFLKDL